MRSFVIRVGFLLGGLIIGLSIAAMSFRVEILVDYDSGAVARVSRMGVLTLRKEPFSTHDLGDIPLANGRTSLTGKPCWKTALLFSGSSRKSPNFGSVLNWAGQLERACRGLPGSEAARAKKAFLEALSRGDLLGAKNLAEEASSKAAGLRETASGRSRLLASISQLGHSVCRKP